METYRLDFKGLIVDLGGPMACYRRLRAMGIKIQPRTVNKWLARDDIGLIYLINLLAHEALTGTPVNLNHYIVREDDPNGPRLPRAGASRLSGRPTSGAPSC